MVMRKLYSILLALFFSTVAIAQTSDEELWGYYMGGADDLTGLGVSSTATFHVAIYVPGNGAIAGAKITAINLPALTTKMTEMAVFGGTTLGATDAFNLRVDEVAVGYNRVALNEPVAIPAAGLYVGYTFTTTSISTTAEKYPIAMGDGEHSGALYLSWQGADKLADYSDGGYGVSGLQLFLTGVPNHDYVATFGAFTGYTIKASESQITVPVLSDSKNGVTDIDYTVTIGENVVTGHADVNIAGGFDKSGKVAVKFTSPAEEGDYTATLAITKVNGNDNQKAAVTTVGTLHNVSRMTTRKSVVEEFTGTGCGYCPRGLQGMANLREAYGDKFVGIGLHWYNSSDPMYINKTEYKSLSFEGAPSCRVDRGAEIDPYFGNGNSIFEDFEEALNQYAPAAVSLTGAWNTSAKDSVTLTASVDALEAGNYGIEFVLVADSLTYNATTWKQSNYYYSYTQASLPDDMKKFGSGGKFGTSKFFYPFDDVAIAGSYKSSSNQAKLGQLAKDEVKSVTFELALPTGTTTAKKQLMEAIKNSIDKVYGIVIITNANGTIANAEKVHIVDVLRETDTAIETVEASAETTAPVKVLSNGQLLINAGGNTYNVSGVKVQ